MEGNLNECKLTMLEPQRDDGHRPPLLGSPLWAARSSAGRDPARNTGVHTGGGGKVRGQERRLKDGRGGKRGEKFESTGI